jgi:alcohol dehydrogenase/propanol-preferring alcohol dehydrogenase
MKAWAIVGEEVPLELIELPTPEPAGTEILLEVTHCGVCHSDLHFWHGSYNMGGGKVMSIKDRGVVLPRAPGHEIVGRVAALGPEAEGVAIGDRRVVYPWIGCGRCEHCLNHEDNLCANQRSLGVIQHGGFATHVLAPHPRYLVDYGDLDPAVAATYACSGITTYGAIRKIMPLAPDDAAVLIGAGGLGLSAVAMLRALGHRNIVSVDISAEKRQAALDAGASAFVDSSGGDVARAIIEAAGGPVKGVIDFVNIDQTARFGLDALVKGGKLVLIGVAGGDLTLSLAAMVFKALTIQGSYTGSLQDLHDVIGLARSGRLKPIPVTRLPRDSANEALHRLHEGQVTGRLVLTDG